MISATRQLLRASVSLLHRQVVCVHSGRRGELQQRGAVVQRLAVRRRAGHAGEVEAQLLNERPLIVHAPLSHILPLACLAVALHQGLHQAGPTRIAACGRAVGRGPQVGACEDVRHGALVPVIVVALADTVRDVDADVREGAHLRQDCLPQGLLSDDAAAPGASVHVVLVEVLVDGRVDVAARVPGLVRALDDEAARVEGLGPARHGELGDQAGVVEGR
mmetsp:Transcript_59647/g.174446  ORF Transcript_59647/g.174446 Transcript_59647/m.174446 type:complete len:219 (+) Transcript_59647:58-714(+)